MSKCRNRYILSRKKIIKFQSQNNKKIYEFQYACSVNNQKNDKPLRLIFPSTMPQSQTFPKNTPDCENCKKETKRLKIIKIHT